DTILEGQIAAIQRENPDRVVGHATVTVGTAAGNCGIPAAGVMNAYENKFVFSTSQFMPIIHAWDKLLLARIRRRIYRKYGVEEADALRMLRNLTMISPDLPGLFPDPAGWPNWHTVGPIYSEPPADLPPWYEELDDGPANIYIT